MKSILKIYSILILLYPLSLSAQMGGGGGGGLSCDNPVVEANMGNGTGSNPTSNCINGPGYYTGSDIDGDGCEDVDYSIENFTTYSFTPPSGSGCATWDLTVTPDANQSIQVTWFEDTSEPNSCGCAGGYDAGDRVENGGGVSGDGKARSLSMTICEGATTTILVDGYAGDNDGGYTVLIDCQPLSVEIVEFTAKVLEDGNVEVAWITAEEKNVDYYLIQRSFNGYQWEDIAEVKPNDGSNYSIIDEKAPYNTNIYYKLREFEKEKKSSTTISKIIKVKKDQSIKNGLNNFYFNSGNKNLEVSLGKEAENPYTVYIYDVNGKEVLQKSIPVGSKEFVFELNEVTTGIYFFSISAPDLEVNEKFIVN